jgi:hypothetical protein
MSKAGRFAYPWEGKARTLRLLLGGQSADASLTPGRAKRGRFAYSWEGKARTLRLLLGEQSGDAPLTSGRAKRGRFAYFEPERLDNS